MRQMRTIYGPLDLELSSAPHIAKMNTYCVLFFTSKEIKSLNQYNVKKKRREWNLIFFSPLENKNKILAQLTWAKTDQVPVYIALNTKSEAHLPIWPIRSLKDKTSPLSARAWEAAESKSESLTLKTKTDKLARLDFKCSLQFSLSFSDGEGTGGERPSCHRLTTQLKAGPPRGARAPRYSDPAG